MPMMPLIAALIYADSSSLLPAIAAIISSLPPSMLIRLYATPCRRHDTMRITLRRRHYRLLLLLRLSSRFSPYGFFAMTLPR